jgi:hypothetical protein
LNVAFQLGQHPKPPDRRKQGWKGHLRIENRRHAVPLLIDDGVAGMKSDCVERLAVHKDLSGRRRAWRSASFINQQASRHRSSGELSGIDSPLRAAGAVRPQDTR